MEQAVMLKVGTHDAYVRIPEGYAPYQTLADYDARYGTWLYDCADGIYADDIIGVVPVSEAVGKDVTGIRIATHYGERALEVYDGLMADGPELSDEWFGDGVYGDVEHMAQYMTTAEGWPARVVWSLPLDEGARDGSDTWLRDRVMSVTVMVPPEDVSRERAHRATRWGFPDCTVSLWDRDTLRVRIPGPDGIRTMDVAINGDRELDALDDGSSPVADHWEDGHGNVVCYDNASPVEPLRIGGRRRWRTWTSTTRAPTGG